MNIIQIKIIIKHLQHLKNNNQKDLNFFLKVFNIMSFVILVMKKYYT